MKRKIIRIDEMQCNGCGLCIPNCPEGALQVIEGKARLVSDLFCDGLGACIGHCPQGAIIVEEREAGAYDEEKVMANIAKQGPAVITAHLEHLKGHGDTVHLNEALAYLKERKIPVPEEGKGAHHHHHEGGCPGSRVVEMKRGNDHRDADGRPAAASELGQWPVQIRLVNPSAPYFKGADILIAADCVPFAYADFHRTLLKGKVLLVGCPKLDDIAAYRERLRAIVAANDIKSITYAGMEVPCCHGFVPVIEEVIAASGKRIPFTTVTVGIKGDVIA